jgi:phosphatidylserine/phosphatidylglycerophosphate/cardiolipin synthase-like enzyme
MEKFASRNGVSVYAYKGDAMTLLAFDLAKDKTENFVGFTVHVSANNRQFYIYNRLRFNENIKLHRKPATDDELLSTEFSPIQKFRWVHVPSTLHFINNPYYGDYTYAVTPRYIKNGKLLKPDSGLTTTVTIDVSPFRMGDVQLGFARAFISSQAFAYHFSNNLNLRPKGKVLTFDIKKEAGKSLRWNDALKKRVLTPFSYEEIHEYLGWQARDRVMEFLKEVVDDKNLRLDVFAYDLNEPVIVDIFLKLAEEGRLKIILDNYPDHVKADSYETMFEAEFKKRAKNKKDIYRGHFGSQAHSKIFIQRKNNTVAKAIKVLTGSTNFTTNGLYVNANHTITFNDPKVAQLYADVFDNSFGDDKMSSFSKSNFASEDFKITSGSLPDMTIRFSPHPTKAVDTFFDTISERIQSAESDVLFAVMIDDSNSQILDALAGQVADDKVFTYGITDNREGVQLYKPNSKRGIKISGLKIATKLGKPFNDIIKVPGLGHNIHHKFVVVDFKGTDPVVYCGSSNLAYNPEKKNGDNLIEFRNKDIVTTFAIEAIRLIDHFYWLNVLMEVEISEEERFLSDDTESVKWFAKYYNPKNLRCLERTLLMK